MRLSGIPTLQWPPNSPNLNIIENVWTYIKNQLKNDPRGLPINKDDLVSRVLEEWQRVPQNFIRKLYASIPRRLLAVISQRGYPTKY